MEVFADICRGEFFALAAEMPPAIEFTRGGGDALIMSAGASVTRDPAFFAIKQSTPGAKSGVR